MKTEFQLNAKVQRILDEASEQFHNIAGVWMLTSDFLLYTIFCNENSKLAKFMTQFGHFEREYLISHKNSKNIERNISEYLQNIYEEKKDILMVFYETGYVICEELIRNCLTQNNNEKEYSEDLKGILLYAQELALEKGKEEIDEDSLLVALVQKPNLIWECLYDDDNMECYDDLAMQFCKSKYLDDTIDDWDELADTIKKLNDIVEVIQKYIKGGEYSIFDLPRVITIKEENDSGHIGEPPVESNENNKKMQSNKTNASKDDDYEIENMFKCLNDKFQKDEHKIICGRDKEIEKVFTIFQRREIRNVILTGAPGVGKTAIAEGIAESIVKGTCREEFKNKKVMSLDLNSLMENTKYVGQAQEKFKALNTYLETHPDVILFIDEIHTIIGAGRGSSSSQDLSNALKPVLAGGKVQVIGATTHEEYKKWICADGALNRRFEEIEVKEPSDKDLWKMLEGKRYQLTQYHKVEVSQEMFEKTVSEAAGYNINVANPARTVAHLDTAMVIAKNSNKKSLDVESILEVNKEGILKFKEGKEICLKEVMGTAYHEAGHYIVNKVLMNKYRKAKLISIIPAVDYVGVNVLENKETSIYYSKTKEYYINLIATVLAGSIAEELKGYNENSGRVSDMNNATKIAREMILKYGMISKSSNDLKLLGKQSNYDGLNCLSDRQKEELAQEVELILKEARIVARKTLIRQDKELEVIAESLKEFGSLTGEQAEELISAEKTVEDLR